jgi:multidrug efflux pump subunit AcrA (membrane-fusion protein)
MLGSSSSVPLVPAERTSLRQSAPEPVWEQRQRRRARARHVRQGIGAAVIGAAAALVALALRPESIPVDAATVVAAPFAVAIEESGRTRVKDRYVVSAPTTGRLTRLWLEPGHTVNEGDTLAEISLSPSPLIDRRTRAEAEARLGAARSSFGPGSGASGSCRDGA